MIKTSLLALAGLALASSAFAQGVNTVPTVGVNSNTVRQQTYSAISVGLVPAAAATDILCINASAARSIAVRRIEVTGSAGTAVDTPIVLLRRATADTGGTAATGLALPVAAANNSNNQNPASATLTAYTANPTITDSSPAYLRAYDVSLATTTTANADEAIWYGGSHNDTYDQGFDLVKGTTQQLCLNLNGATVSSGYLVINLEWIEQ